MCIQENTAVTYSSLGYVISGPNLSATNITVTPLLNKYALIIVSQNLTEFSPFPSTKETMDLTPQ